MQFLSQLLKLAKWKPSSAWYKKNYFKINDSFIEEECITIHSWMIEKCDRHSKITCWNMKKQRVLQSNVYYHAYSNFVMDWGEGGSLRCVCTCQEYHKGNLMMIGTIKKLLLIRKRHLKISVHNEERRLERKTHKTVKAK